MGSELLLPMPPKVLPAMYLPVFLSKACTKDEPYPSATSSYSLKDEQQGLLKESTAGILMYRVGAGHDDGVAGADGRVPEERRDLLQDQQQRYSQQLQGSLSNRRTSS